MGFFFSGSEMSQKEKDLNERLNKAESKNDRNKKRNQQSWAIILQIDNQAGKAASKYENILVIQRLLAKQLTKKAKEGERTKHVERMKIEAADELLKQKKSILDNEIKEQLDESENKVARLGIDISDAEVLHDELKSVIMGIAQENESLQDEITNINLSIETSEDAHKLLLSGHSTQTDRLTLRLNAAERESEQVFPASDEERQMADKIRKVQRTVDGLQSTLDTHLETLRAHECAARICKKKIPSFEERGRRTVVKYANAVEFCEELARKRPKLVSPKTKRRFMIDVANMAYAAGQEHIEYTGGGRLFYARGYLALVERLIGKGGSIGFLPEFHYNSPDFWKRASDEDVEILKDLIARGHLILTPNGYDDDIFILEWAAKHGYVIISNDWYSGYLSEAHAGTFGNTVEDNKNVVKAIKGSVQCCYSPEEPIVLWQ